MDLEPARAAFAKARELNPHDAQTVRDEALMLHRAQKAEEASALIDSNEKALQEAELLPLERAHALGLLSRTKAEILASDENRSEESLTAWRRAFELDPDDNELRLGLAVALASAGLQAESDQALLDLYARTEGFSRPLRSPQPRVLAPR